MLLLTYSLTDNWAEAWGEWLCSSSQIRARFKPHEESSHM